MGASVVGEASGESGRGVDVGERGLGGPLTTGMSLSSDARASGWSAAGTGEGDALADDEGVLVPDASPTANLARSLSSSVVLPAGRGLGAGVGADSAAAGDGEAVRPGLWLGLAGRWMTRVFLRLLKAASASWEEDEKEVRMLESVDSRAGVSGLDAS